MMSWQTAQAVRDARLYMAVPSPRSLAGRLTLSVQHIDDLNNTQFIECLSGSEGDAAYLRESLARFADLRPLLAHFDIGRLTGEHFLSLSLLYHSLPSTFLHSDIAALLVAVSPLASAASWAHRLNRTTATLRRILSGLGPHGTGLIALWQLSQQHLAFRQDDRHRDRSGCFLMNQASLAYALLAFSYLPVVGWRSGFDLPWLLGDAQAEDWLKLWTFIGDFMGIDPAGQASTCRDAELLLTALRAEDAPRRVHPHVTVLMDAFRKACIEPSSLEVPQVRQFTGEALATLLGLG